MRAPALFSLLLVLSFARTALGFECAVVPRSVPERTQAWTQRCVPYWIDGFSTLLLQDNNLDLIQESFEVWSNPDCTDFSFINVGFTIERVGFDPQSDENRNVVLATRSAEEAAEIMEEPDLLAITITAFSVETGELLDADIVLNGALFLFDDIPSTTACIREGVAKFDLRNTMVHEVGHFIGFDHDADTTSTMFAEAEPCETLKRDLAATDLEGLCTVYPAGKPTATCSPPDDGYGDSRFLRQFRNQCGRLNDTSCACVAAARGPTGGGFLVLLGFAVVLRRRARR